MFTKEKAKNGEGRKANIKHLLLPEEVVQELKLYKEAYSICLSREKDEWGNPVPVRVSWEQMFRRWMDNIGRFDKDIKDYVDEGKKYREENPPAPTYPVDPTEGEVWDMRYFFVKDAEEIKAYVEKLWFSAKLNGEERSSEELRKDGWILQNDAGVEISPEQEAQIALKIQLHRDTPSPSQFLF